VKRTRTSHRDNINFSISRTIDPNLILHPKQSVFIASVFISYPYIVIRINGIIILHKIIDTPIDIRAKLIASLVDEAAAIELEGFLQACHTLPTMEEIIANPATARIPENPATQYAVAYALSRHVKATSMAQAVTYLKRLSAEFLAMFMVDIGQHNSELVFTKEYTQWAIEAQDMTLAA